MRTPLAIRTRLQLGAALVLVVFLCLAGFALQKLYSDDLRASHYARLQSEIYLLLAAAELDADGRVQMPPTLAEPLFALPNSGLYAVIDNPQMGERWQSPSSLGVTLPAGAVLTTGEWRFLEQPWQQRLYLAAAYQVRWTIGGQTRPLQFRVYEDEKRFAGQVRAFRTALWGWLGGAGLLLLLVQTLLLQWGLRPLRQVEHELGAIEDGRQTRISGVYPPELAPLTQRLNRLVEQERQRQSRYRDALADLAHSLKTPLAVLRAAQQTPSYPALVDEQLQRMEQIVQHQLGRAAARGHAELAAALPLAPHLQRMIAAMEKVHAGRALVFELDCPPALSWPLDEGDLYELCGNLLDNAAKWARQRVVVKVSLTDAGLLLQVADDGPGFADAAAALQRGVRLDERVPGHGIGLTVVADIVAAYGAQLQLLASPLGGAQVDLFFPKESA